MTLREMMKKYEREMIIEALRRIAPGANHGRGGRFGTVAKELGISRKCLWEKCRAMGIDKDVEVPQQQLPLVPAAPTPSPYPTCPACLKTLESCGCDGLQAGAAAA